MIIQKLQYVHGNTIILCVLLKCMCACVCSLIHGNIDVHNVFMRAQYVCVPACMESL